MKRSTPLPRGKSLTRTIGINPRNRRRRKAAHARNFGDETAAVVAMPCIVGVALGTFEQCVGKIEPAHNPSRGAGGGRFDQCPMCKGHHGEQHQIGVESFQLKYGLDLRLEADRIALEHPSPLGIRGLADRTVPRCACGHEWAARPDGCDCIAPRTNPLGTYERDALLGWVRRWLARDVGHHGRSTAHDRDTGTCFLADKLHIRELLCREMIAASGGWPEVGRG